MQHVPFIGINNDIQDSGGALESGIPARGLMPVSGGSGKTIKPGAISRALPYLWFCLNNSSVVSLGNTRDTQDIPDNITIRQFFAPVNQLFPLAVSDGEATGPPLYTGTKF